MDILNLVVMVLVGAVSGTLAARIMKGDTYGFAINALLGIAGAVVGGMLFNFLGLTPGKGITKILSDTFGVDLPTNIVGMVVSATVGAIIILWVSRMFKGTRGRRR